MTSQNKIRYKICVARMCIVPLVTWSLAFCRMDWLLRSLVLHYQHLGFVAWVDCFFFFSILVSSRLFLAVDLVMSFKIIKGYLDQNSHESSEEKLIQYKIDGLVTLEIIDSLNNLNHLTGLLVGRKWAEEGILRYLLWISYKINKGK